MKTYSTQQISSQAKAKNFEGVKNFFNKFIVEPLGSGLFGFAVFFSVLIITKFVAFAFGVQQAFFIDFNDVLLSLIGFILLVAIKLLENISSLSKNK